MVCIAAFIVLILIGIVVAFLSIFNRELGRKYLKLLKKSWHCFSKRVRLQKCDTSFSDDVKTTLLKKVVIRKPKLVKPLSITIEIASILVVVLTVWSVVEATKAGLALWTFGTCNVSRPSSCALGAESCSLDAEDPKNPVEFVGRWFSEWGEIFSNIPDRLRDWKAENFIIEPMPVLNPGSSGEAALDVIDPLCSACAQSYKNQLKDEEFMQKHKVFVMLYPIPLPDGGYKFENSEIIARYFHALTLLGDDSEGSEDSEGGSAYAGLDMKLLDRIFTGKDENGDYYQALFNRSSKEEVEKTMLSWLKEWGLHHEERDRVTEKAKSDDVAERMAEIRQIVDTMIKPKGIPTLIYDGKKHLGVYKK